MQQWQLWWDFADSLWVFCLIVGSFALTLMADATRVPKKAPTFFWQHWWHTPILIYTNIAALYALTLVSLSSIALVHSYLLAQAVATILAFLFVSASWLFLTRRSQPLSVRRDDQNHFPGTIPLLIGAALSLLGLLLLVLNSLGFWVFAYVHIWAIGLGPWLALIGFIIYIAAFPLRLHRENGQSKYAP